MTEPLDPVDAKLLIQRILDEGAVRYSPHSFEERKDDFIEIPDVENTLRCGRCGKPDYRADDAGRWSWRYPISTAKFCVVVSFDDETSLAIVTAWRIRKIRKSKKR